MYACYFGLDGLPFRERLDGARIYHHLSFESVRAELLDGIDKRLGLMLVTGDDGAGKTTLLSNVLESLRPGTHAIPVLRCAFGLSDFIQANANSLKLTLPADNIADSTAAVQECLAFLNVAGEAPVVLIDDAENLDVNVLTNLVAQYRLDAGEETLAQVILVTRPEFERTLRAPALRQLNQQISKRCRLYALTVHEVGRYIELALANVGNERDDIFTADAVAAIAVSSRGVPRQIDSLCDAALLVAFECRQNVVTREVVDTARREMEDMTLGTPTEQQRGEGALGTVNGVIAPATPPVKGLRRLAGWSELRESGIVRAAARLCSRLRTTPRSSSDHLQEQTTPFRRRDTEPHINFMQVARQRRSHDRQSRLSAAALGMFGGLAAVIAFSMFSNQPTNTTINTRQIAAASKHLRQLEVAVDTARAERERLQLDLSTLAARRSQLGREFATIRVEYGQLVATLQQMVAARQDYLVSFSEPAISEKLLETTTAGDASSASQTSNRASSQTTQRASTSVTTTNTIATYQVLPGDTLWTIANRHDVTVSSLAEANGVNELETLVAGRLLVLKPNAPISTTDASEADGRQPDTSPPPGTPFVRAIHYLVSVRSSPRAWIPYASGIS